MGKGRGKGKGGCCSNRCCVTTIVTTCFIVALALIVTGVVLMAGAKKANGQNLKKAVNAAVSSWDAPRARFAQLSASVALTSFTCTAQTLTLTSANCPTDVYLDLASRYRSVPQLKLCGAVDYATFTSCRFQASFRVLGPNASAPVTTPVPGVVSSSPSTIDMRMSDIGGPDQCSASKKCHGGEYNSCRNKCHDKFGGIFTCSSSRGYACTASAFSDNLAIKVSYNSSGSPALDFVAPVLGSGGAGANVLRRGFTWAPGPFGQVGSGPSWQVNRVAFATLPARLTFTVRSSADPWLTYMAVTGGSGYFGSDKRILTIVGIVMLSLGGILLLAGTILACCMCKGNSLMRDQPNDRPDGCVGGKAWDLGSWMAERQHQHHQHAHGGQVVPVKDSNFYPYPVAAPVQDPYHNPYGPPNPPAPAPYYPYPQQQQYAVAQPPPPPYAQQQPYPGAPPPPPYPQAQQPYPGAPPPPHQEQQLYQNAPPPPPPHQEQQPYQNAPPPPPPHQEQQPYPNAPPPPPPHQEQQPPHNAPPPPPYQQEQQPYPTAPPPPYQQQQPYPGPPPQPYGQAPPQPYPPHQYGQPQPYQG